MQVTREVALTEVWLDEQARTMRPATISGTVRDMGWRHAAIIAGLAGLVYGFLLFT